MNIKKMQKILVSSLVFLPHICGATSVTGTIEEIYALQFDRAAVKLNEYDKDSLNLIGSSSCITTNAGTFVIELTSGTGGNSNPITPKETGIAQYALLLSAEAQGKSITITGLDVCLSGREKINWLRINN